MEQVPTYDCIVIGGGPGGLTAAEYLGRFLRKTLVIDSGHSRAALIPETHNYPGFPQGISGVSFLGKLREHVDKLGVTLQQGEVIDVKKSSGVFEIITTEKRFMAHAVIVATGIIDDQPNIPGLESFIYNGVVRFCPVCDGFEARDKRVGIVGPCSRIYSKARFLRTYTDKIVLFPLDYDDCNQDDKEQLRRLNIAVPDITVKSLTLRDDGVTGVWEDGTENEVDILYPAMGAQVRAGFLKNIGVVVNESGCVFTDAHQQTNVENLYAVGDITLDLSQISVATGQAAIAATSVHNSLPLNCRSA